ncbi:MAG: hypothetical protein A3J63_04515 [Candidatus Moranbacteria bacterium RIFCSPHIGHO2_02_FULL_40_12b]|nr:MAG: hypothetical protein A3J63_04515 [Candidatus Moranbacteria bacterium RIFCSPHIGHO2_02_FULL_40_12b]OGI23875.1 MAG: hypothetical protein A3E91_00590 [Candidatus Moranbacteria bacterium RIFCSPHIGHO2_12_FULL_40_10]
MKTLRGLFIALTVQFFVLGNALAKMGSGIPIIPRKETIPMVCDKFHYILTGMAIGLAISLLTAFAVGLWNRKQKTVG